MADKLTDAQPRTTYQVHVSHVSDSDTHNVIDFTERRLLAAARNATSTKVRNNIMTLLRSYRDGIVTIAWSGGHPVFHRIEPKKRVEQKLDPVGG